MLIFYTLTAIAITVLLIAATILFLIGKKEKADRWLGIFLCSLIANMVWVFAGPILEGMEGTRSLSDTGNLVFRLISLSGYCALLYFVLLRNTIKDNPNQLPDPTATSRRGSSLSVEQSRMLCSVPKCIPVGAPSMAVPPEPLIIAERDLQVVYRGSPSGEEDKWVIARFAGYLQFTHGYPNDEALGAHPLAKHGLKFYDVFEVQHSPMVEEIKKRNRIHPRHSDAMFAKERHWVFTFQDETLDVIGSDAPIFAVVTATSASDALQKNNPEQAAGDNSVPLPGSSLTS